MIPTLRQGAFTGGAVQAIILAYFLIASSIDPPLARLWPGIIWLAAAGIIGAAFGVAGAILARLLPKSVGLSEGPLLPLLCSIAGFGFEFCALLAYSID
jgi:hypothetical protein